MIVMLTMHRIAALRIARRRPDARQLAQPDRFTYQISHLPVLDSGHLNR